MSSKARSRLQRLAVIAAVLGAALVGGAGQTMPDGRPTPSGQPVPRWLSLKSSEVRARSGPGLDYNILWEYRAPGLPVQVVAETTEWRKICDPAGAVAWVHRSVVSSRRSVFNTSDVEVPIRIMRKLAARLRRTEQRAQEAHGALDEFKRRLASRDAQRRQRRGSDLERTVKGAAAGHVEA